jgi:hypothetical protein
MEDKKRHTWSRHFTTPKYTAHLAIIDEEGNNLVPVLTLNEKVVVNVTESNNKYEASEDIDGVSHHYDQHHLNVVLMVVKVK